MWGGRRCPGTKGVTMYTDIFRKLYQRNGELGWSDVAAEHLTRRIINFKKGGEE